MPVGKTAGEAGWRASRYNLAARIPDSEKIAVANLFRGTCSVCSPIEMFLLDEVESLDEHHPILDRFRERGLIVNLVSCRRSPPWPGWAAPEDPMFP